MSHLAAQDPGHDLSAAEENNHRLRTQVEDYTVSVTPLQRMSFIQCQESDYTADNVYEPTHLSTQLSQTPER